MQRFANALQFGEVAPKGEIHQLSQQRQFTPRSWQFKVAETQEGRRHPAHHGARLRRGVTAVSYTHLDVYKRQDFDTLVSILDEANAEWKTRDVPFWAFLALRERDFAELED